jgi:hypothetical protein
MSRYRAYLPAVFPYCAFVPWPDLARVVAVLTTPDAEYPAGSSFAVTADVSDDTSACLYLSRVSRERVIDLIGVTDRSSVLTLGGE